MPGFGPKTPDASAGSSASAESMDLQLEGKELKVLTPAYLKKFIEGKTDFATLRATLERDFPGYTLPSEADLAALKLVGGERKIENLGKLTGGFAEDKFNLFSCEEDGAVNRTEYLNDPGKTKQEITEQNRDWPHLKEDDCLFLIKKNG